MAHTITGAQLSGSGAQLSGSGAQLSGSGAQLSESGAQLSAISAYLHTSYLGAQLSASRKTPITAPISKNSFILRYYQAMSCPQCRHS